MSKKRSERSYWFTMDADGVIAVWSLRPKPIFETGFGWDASGTCIEWGLDRAFAPAGLKPGGIIKAIPQRAIEVKP